ncbi:MAG: hypothetical protein ACP5TE_14320, partial [Verrucomicrobiia bacterium]
MQTITIKTLGLKFNVDVPTTAEEFDQIAGQAGACVKEAVANVLYRSVFAHARAAVCERIASTGFPRKTRTVKSNGKETVVIDETEAEYVRRYLAATGKSIADLENIVAGIQLKFDPARKARIRSTPKVRISKR